MEKTVCFVYNRGKQKETKSFFRPYPYFYNRVLPLFLFLNSLCMIRILHVNGISWLSADM
ncbi:MAG: hypothetical protein EA357_02745 [Micavibrio sp.]|nr:MAG: hypothetical protein EA357_02745 [Micavibrio sp.]